MIEDLPEPIKTDLLRSVNFVKNYTLSNDVFGVKELIYCLRQTYLKRTKPKPVSLKVAALINRGVMLDKRYCSLFPRNQIKVSYRCKNSPVVINGKLDFYDENNLLTELKFPVDLRNVSGVSEADKKQVQFYAVCEKQSVAQVLYFDGLDCKKFPVTIYGWETLFSELEVNAALLYHCLIYRQLPEKTKFCSLCNNCEYNNGEC
jgi:hypothetical protein